MPHFKTPYELFKGRLPALSFIRPFGGHVTILYTLNQLGKFDGKSDEGIFVGYSTISKAFRVYNIMTRKVEENLHITFLENKPMIAGGGPEWLFDIDALLKSMNYAIVPTCINSNDFVVNTVTSPYASYPNDPLIPDLEDARIFNDAYDDRDEGAEADYNNLEIVISTKIHVDNESAVCVVNNHVYHSKTKHIKIRHNFIRDSYEKRLIEMVKIRTDYNVADLLTKAFDLTRFQFLIASIGLKLKWYLINDGYADLVQHARHTYYCQKKVNAAKHKLTTADLQALLDGKKVVITEASIRHDLQLNDAECTSCLPNAMIFEELARMGAKPTSWNEFSSTIASAIICLANNQKFNFSKYILDNLKKNLEAGVPFFMFPRFIQVFVNHKIGDMPHHKGIYVNPYFIMKVFANMKRVGTRKHKPRRKERKERKETEVSPTELHTQDHVPTPSNDPLPSGEDSMPLKELMVLCTNLSNKVLDMENKVTEEKTSHKVNIAELESRVEKLEDANRKIADIDAYAEVNLENVYNLDVARKETVLSMQDVIDANGKEVAEEMVEVITTAKIIVDEVSTVGGELNAANEEPVKDKGKAKLVKEPKVLKSRKAQIVINEEVARRIEADWNADMKDNIDWNKVIKQVQSRQSDAVRKYQALKRKPVSVAQARKNMMIYLKNMAGYKMEFFKGISYKEIKHIFEEEYNKVQTLFKEGQEIDAERIKDSRKRTRKEKVEKD
uniref:Retrovirus-related Pol polyprotein from transposon TNT 1-94 n=1 Tax=Tanacetum cinerariifolium TaxID=118510 RepID=A0A699HY95_TANCI|nr:retrovirus-related Pol polyprotein from transposon TNT 1-94 [Tanacetum cinerariifolium]